jgi:hypothetical protein
VVTDASVAWVLRRVLLVQTIYMKEPSVCHAPLGVDLAVMRILIVVMNAMMDGLCRSMVFVRNAVI